jgi:hypothetical protein
MTGFWRHTRGPLSMVGMWRRGFTALTLGGDKWLESGVALCRRRLSLWTRHRLSAQERLLKSSLEEYR